MAGKHRFSWKWSENDGVCILHKGPDVYARLVKGPEMWKVYPDGLTPGDRNVEIASGLFSFTAREGGLKAVKERLKVHP